MHGHLKCILGTFKLKNTLTDSKGNAVFLGFVPAQHIYHKEPTEQQTFSKTSGLKGLNIMDGTGHHFIANGFAVDLLQIFLPHPPTHPQRGAVYL